MRTQKREKHGIGKSCSAIQREMLARNTSYIPSRPERGAHVSVLQPSPNLLTELSVGSKAKAPAKLLLKNRTCHFSLFHARQNKLGLSESRVSCITTHTCCSHFDDTKKLKEWLQNLHYTLSDLEDTWSCIAEHGAGSSATIPCALL